MAKKKIEDLPARDVKGAEARTIKGGKVSVSEIQITKVSDAASTALLKG